MKYHSVAHSNYIQNYFDSPGYYLEYLIMIISVFLFVYFTLPPFRRFFKESIWLIKLYSKAPFESNRCFTPQTAVRFFYCRGRCNSTFSEMFKFKHFMHPSTKYSLSGTKCFFSGLGSRVFPLLCNF